jgi:hypothetical protein
MMAQAEQQVITAARRFVTLVNGRINVFGGRWGAPCDLDELRRARSDALTAPDGVSPDGSSLLPGETFRALVAKAFAQLKDAEL